MEELVHILLPLHAFSSRQVKKRAVWQLRSSGEKRRPGIIAATRGKHAPKRAFRLPNRAFFGRKGVRARHAPGF
ncbi:hypothetical protein, partial [Gordonibacter pamelaeae]|uniref:hypothetical protein n=1 Tax=Gordonibacter pamelaeae TaxID=471189 RepID=UPI00266FDCB2